ncbi:MAG: septum formation initiator family protein [Nitrospirae bacterium]|nr:septum formation initiator family protein [Nitrospirota bacterium]
MLVVMALFLGLTLSLVFGEKGLLRYMKLREQRAAINAEIVALKANNVELGRTVESLKTDPEYIEKLAREQGLVKEDEIIYQYEEEPAGGQPVGGPENGEVRK